MRPVADRNGKEGVGGSSPPDGSAKSAANRRFLFHLDLHNHQCALGMEAFWQGRRHHDDRTRPTAQPGTAGVLGVRELLVGTPLHTLLNLGAGLELRHRGSDRITAVREHRRTVGDQHALDRQ